MSNDFLFIWADSGLSTKSNHVNAPYHFVHIGEIINYVQNAIGEEIDLLDIEAEQTEFQNIMEKVIENKYKAIAFYINTENLQNTIKLEKIIKEILPTTKTIAYGDMPIYLPNKFKNTSFDAIVAKCCDQEVAIADFFKYAREEKSEKELRGVLLIKDDILLKCADGVFLSPDEWGFTDIKKVPLDKYFEMEKKEQIVLTVARGCPYNCPYCNAVLYYGLKERRRPIQSIINYINSLDYEYYKFFAPDFTLNEKYALDLSKALIEKSKKIKWSCTTRPDLLENEELIKAMAESGCYKIAIGIESIEKEDLKSINKRYDNKNRF